jgi:hypothetical protein
MVTMKASFQSFLCSPIDMYSNSVLLSDTQRDDLLRHCFLFTICEICPF